MSENAKKKRSRKQSPEELLNEAVANHESSFESWQSYLEFGGLLCDNRTKSERP